MKVYLVWEQESYCEYDVIAVYTDEKKAQDFAEQQTGDNEYYVTEKEVVE